MQSRIKALKRLPMLEQVAEDPSLRFKLKEPEPLSPPLLQLVDVTFKYKKKTKKSPTHLGEESESTKPNGDTSDGSDELLIVRDCQLNVDMDSRIAVSSKQSIFRTIAPSSHIERCLFYGACVSVHVLAAWLSVSASASGSV